MIILFEENETLFTNLGLGVLKDAKSCSIKEGLNDIFELELQYPITGSNFSEIKLNRIIFAPPNPYSEPQPFRIDSISKPINGIITVKAIHISYDMNGLPVKPISGGTPSIVLDKIQNGSLINHNFKFYTDITDSKSFKTSNYYNMRALLMGSEESILEIYKGEILFDKFNVHVLKRRGSNKGASVRYAKNMKDLTHEVNYERLYNGVYPFYHKEEVEVSTDTSPDGFKQVYIVGTKPFQDGWLSYEPSGEPYHPVDESPVQIATDGDYKDKVFVWNTTTQRYTEKVYNEMVNLIEYVTDLIAPSDKPSWIYIDVTGLPNIVVKANTDGYFKLASEQEWSKKLKGEIVFQGSITNATEGLVMYYSEVIPSGETSTETETTNITHIELDEKIIWLETAAALDMKYDRVLCLDLTSEFDEAPDKEALEAKAKEYIEKNKIGQYKYDTKVAFVDLSSTTEGIIYDKMETIELGDTVRVVYEDLNVDVELRVISTTFNVLTNKYTDIELGEKSEKISSSSVQTGDNVSSLTNDVGYTDVTTVTKLIAKTITADLIQAKNAKLSKAQIEELQTARIKITGMIEATQFELDTLVAKMLTADNAVIKQTLEAGTVKVKGDITVTRGSIQIENTESGTVFNVDRDGNVTANSVKITGGELNINDTFTVTPEGKLTALGADIQGRIEAESGLIAKFNIESDTIEGDTSNRIWSGTVNNSGYVLMSPGYNIRISTLDNEESTRDTHDWAFVAGQYFGVDNQGNLYAKNAVISGDIEATSGHISGFTIATNKLWANYVEISPDKISYGQNNEFVITKNGTVTIQNGSDPTVQNYKAITLDSNGLVATAITVNDAIINRARINLGFIGGFIIGQVDEETHRGAIYKDIPSFDAEGSLTGVYLGPDGLRIGKNLKIYPDGRIESESREYSENVQYSKGDFCTNTNQLYECIENTTGPWDITKWEKLSMKSFGVNSSGELLAYSAKIVGKITAEEGYIGTPEKGFKITSDAIYSGYSEYDALATESRGIYLGTDGIRLGKRIESYDQVDLGNLSPTDPTIIKSIYYGQPGTDHHYIGAEFVLSYDPVDYDRYISLIEQETDSEFSNNYYHVNNPYFIPIIGKTTDEEELFEIANDDYIYITVDDATLWEYEDVFGEYFKGTNDLRLYFNLVSEETIINIDVYDTEDDWINHTSNYHTKNITISENTSNVLITLQSISDSPWLRFKISSGQTKLTNCKIQQDIPKWLLLPAGSSEITFTVVQYPYLRFHYEEAGAGDTITNLKLSLKVLPGFSVTNSGFVTMYDATIRGGSIKVANSIGTVEFEASSDGTLKAKGLQIENGSISIKNQSETVTFIANSNGILEAKGLSIIDGTISIGSHTQSGQTITNFIVDANGNLIARSATIYGHIEATSGHIGGLTINSNDNNAGLYYTDISSNLLLNIDPTKNPTEGSDITGKNAVIYAKSLITDFFISPHEEIDDSSEARAISYYLLMDNEGVKVKRQYKYADGHIEDHTFSELDYSSFQRLVFASDYGSVAPWGKFPYGDKSRNYYGIVSWNGLTIYSGEDFTLELNNATNRIVDVVSVACNYDRFHNNSDVGSRTGNLPFHITRGSNGIVSITIYNDMDKDVEVSLTAILKIT